MNTLQLPKARTTTYGIESVSFLGSLLWHALPESLKKSENLAVFKKNLRSWNGLDCKCRLCKMYIADLGVFIVDFNDFVFCRTYHVNR